MQIQSVEHFDRGRLLDSLRRTRLRGFDGARPYENAELELVPFADTQALTPAQRYVMKAGVEKVLQLRESLLPFGVDVFALDGGAYIRTSDDPDDVVPVIPPIVEESIEPQGQRVLIINDGIHRLYAARSVGLPVRVVVVRGVPARYPYYARPLRAGWSEVAELDELPDNFQKKEYRDPYNYKALFREFNEVFPGVQKQRKRSNPRHLRA